MGKYQFLDEDYDEPYHNNGLKGLSCKRGMNRGYDNCRWDNGWDNHNYKATYTPPRTYPSYRPTYQQQSGYNYPREQYMQPDYTGGSYNPYQSEYDRYYPEYTNYGTNNYQTQTQKTWGGSMSYYERLIKEREEREEKEAQEKKELQEKIDSIGHDIVFSQTPSKEFLEMLMMEDDEVDEHIQLFITDYDKSDDSKIEMDMSKSTDRKITFEVDIEPKYDDEYHDLLGQMEEELEEFTENENKYKYVEKDNDKDLINKLMGVDSEWVNTDKDLSENVDPVLKTSELPLGYSSVDINESEYEIVEKNVTFDDNVIEHEYDPESDDENQYDNSMTNIFPFNVLFGY